mmetsp:Transcript_2840/g.5040  ORF Transcript_2840/g.5040 Transcript_2840/m.5040 type:complete len:90 (+) Transcript_2840:46-315(+)
MPEILVPGTQNLHCSLLIVFSLVSSLPIAFPYMDSRNAPNLLRKGLSYHRGFLTPDEQSCLQGDIDSRSWTRALARRTQQYGFRFDWFN